jgi:hypothetical protein
MMNFTFTLSTHRKGDYKSIEQFSGKCHKITNTPNLTKYIYEAVNRRDTRRKRLLHLCETLRSFVYLCVIAFNLFRKVPQRKTAKFRRGFFNTFTTFILIVKL